MKKLLGICLSLALCIGLHMPNTAAAQWGGYGLGSIYGSNYGSPVWQYSYNGRVPPYFAVHPPVYYSGQINRIPYGSSPYAALPQSNCQAHRPMMGAGAMNMGNADQSAGQMIVNPHYKAGAGKTTHTPAATNTQSAGVMISNPHYQPTTRVAQR